MVDIKDELADIHVSLADEGEQVFTDGMGRQAVSPILIQAFRLTRQYRDEMADARTNLQKRVDARIEKDEKAREMLTSLHLEASELLTREDFEAALTNLELTLEEPVPYKEPRPTEYQVGLLLEAEAKKKLSGVAFWELSKRREEYVAWHFETRMAKELQEWEQRRATYEAEEAAAVERENQARADAYERDKTRLEGALSGERKSIEDAITEWIKSVEVPYAFSASVSFSADDGHAELGVSLPVQEDLPQSHMVRLENGGMREKAFTQTEINKLLSEISLSLCGYLVANVFNASPIIDEVRLDARVRRSQLVGRDKDVRVIGGAVTRRDVDSSRFRSKSPEAYAARIGLDFSLGKNGELKPLSPSGRGAVGEQDVDNRASSERPGGISALKTGLSETDRSKIPKVAKVPKVKLPKIEIPTPNIGEINVPKIDLPKINFPASISRPNEDGGTQEERTSS